MSLKEAQKILEALAQGIDPSTGELLPEPGVWHSPAVIRALFLGAQALQQLNTSRHNTAVETNPTVSNAGKPWTPEEEEALLAAFDDGTPLAEIAANHGRSQGGIAARLVRLGRIEERSEVYPRESRTNRFTR